MKIIEYITPKLVNAGVTKVTALDTKSFDGWCKHSQAR